VCLKTLAVVRRGYAEFSEEARKVCLEGIAAVYRIARSHPDPSIQLAAWKLLFERDFGKPVAPVAVNLEADVQHNFVVVAPPTVLSSADWEAEHRQLQIEDQSLLLQEQVRNRTKNLSRVGDRGHRVRTCPAARCRQAVEAGPATGGFAHTQRRHAGPPRHRVSGRAGELRGFRIAGRTASLRPSPVPRWRSQTWAPQVAPGRRSGIREIERDMPRSSDIIWDMPSDVRRDAPVCTARTSNPPDDGHSACKVNDVVEEVGINPQLHPQDRSKAGRQKGR
jgi:hypothetical protein